MKRLLSIALVGILLIGVFLSGCVGSTEDPKNEEIARAMSSVANGKGVIDASAYTKSKGLHPVVIITSSGEIDSWNSEIPQEWQPKLIGETQLVAVITKGANSLQTCAYTGPSVTRYQCYVKADLREAKTGNLVKSTTLYGSVPVQCRQRERMSVTALYGSSVEFSQLKDWLQGYVMS
ncbi:MAG: hypothetical protein NTZ84_02835 [Candidatus Nealsonbacteria bacterium]|nr:hypothetical protein [Candidatus Nealsonbacteria bacterium]